MISRLPIVVRSTECDGLGHVNNAVYQQWFEWGRFEWMRETGLVWKELAGPDLSLVVVHVSLDYRREAVRDDRLVIETVLAKLGTRSVTFVQRVVHEAGPVAAEGKVVLASFDVRTRRSAALSAEVRARMAALVRAGFDEG